MHASNSSFNARLGKGDCDYDGLQGRLKGAGHSVTSPHLVLSPVCLSDVAQYQ